MMKVILHIDDVEKWNMVIDNVKNMSKYSEKYDEPVDIEVLANGIAIMELVKNKSNFNKELTELSNKAVFTVCRNSMNKFKVNKEDLFEFVNDVPAGVIEIVKKQQDGYSYIKP